MRRSWVQVPFPAGLKKSVFTGFFVVLRICFFDKSRLNYFTKLFKYRTAGIREYWIVDPEKERTTVYRYAEDAAPIIFPFHSPVSAGLYPDLEILISSLLKDM